MTWHLRSLGLAALAASACGDASEVQPGSGGGPTTESTTDGTAGPVTSEGTGTTAQTGTMSGTTMTTTAATSQGTTDTTTMGVSSGPTSTTAEGSTGPAPVSCSNDVQDGDESDVDCGGARCLPCEFGQMCGSGADCINDTCPGSTCELPAPLIWLDGLDPATLFTNPACNQSAPNDGDEIDCWGNKGSDGGNFVDVVDPGTYDAGGGVACTGDAYALNGVFGGGNLASVTVFVVMEELNTGEAFAFNLNHNDLSGAGRYAARIPNSSAQRRIQWDPAGDGNRVQTPAQAFDASERHLTGFENSGFLNQRAIYLDGLEVAQANDNVSGPADGVSICNDGDMRIREFRVYAPALGPTARQEVEGDMACRWDLRDELPVDHPYHNVDGSNQAGCP